MSVKETGGPTDSLLDFDQLHEDSSQDPMGSERPRYSKWTPWAQGVASVCGLGVSIGIRALSLYLETNALASVGIGFAAVSLVTSAASPLVLARIRQVVFPIIGQTSLYAFSQAWANAPSRVDQIAFDNVISAFGGGNLQLALGMLFEKGLIRSESYPQQTPLTHGLKFVAAGGCGAVSFLTKDLILQPVSAYFFSLLLAQVFGEKMIDWIDKKIEEQNRAGYGSRWNTFKSGLLTLSFVGQILTFSLLPSMKSEGAERLLHLRISGALLGLFDGMLVRSQGDRIERRVEDLEELTRLAPPEEGWKRTVYRVWKVCVPLFATGALLGFSIWQTFFKLHDKEAKIGLWLTLVGVVGGIGLCHLGERAWDLDERNYYKKKFMSSIWYSHRLLGVDPIYYYYALIHSIKMDSTAIASEQSPLRVAAICLAWFFYGLRWGHELFIGSSERIGNAQIKYPKMVLFNSAMTTSYYIAGAN